MNFTSACTKHNLLNLQQYLNEYLNGMVALQLILVICGILCDANAQEHIMLPFLVYS